MWGMWAFDFMLQRENVGPEAQYKRKKGLEYQNNGQEKEGNRMRGCLLKLKEKRESCCVHNACAWGQQKINQKN